MTLGVGGIMSTLNLIFVALVFAITVGATFMGYIASPVAAFRLRRHDRRKGTRSQDHDRRDEDNSVWSEVAYWIHKTMWAVVAVILLVDFVLTFAPAIR
jgi:quinol-cytochrome oxidoreductase complex cytochrome b subunit